MLPETVADAIVSVCECAKMDSAYLDACRVVWEWLDAEPQMPTLDWSKAPTATHHAYTSDGFGVWLWEMAWHAPLARTDKGWGPSSHIYESYYYLPVGIDWRTTLQRRPT